MYARYGKRVLDLAIAAVAIVLLAPVMIGTALLVRAFLGSPIIFRQQRAGWHAALFTLYKFRTMNDRRDAAGQLLPDAVRLTRMGRFLRATSLDELPQLFNVLRGEVSLVGPRPLLPEYLGRYTPEQARRHDVRPGITGLAQVRGRQSIPFSQRFELDVWYTTHVSLLLDLKLLLLSPLRVLSGAGVKSGQDVREVDDVGLSLARGETLSRHVAVHTSAQGSARRQEVAA